jgi:hypothetical protein
MNIGNQFNYISESFKELSKEFTKFVLFNAEKGNKERENRKQDSEKEYQEQLNHHKIMIQGFQDISQLIEQIYISIKMI